MKLLAFSTSLPGILNIATLIAGLSVSASSSHAGTPMGVPTPTPTPISFGSTGRFSDTPLTPGGSPPAAVGNDLLLAETVMGPKTANSYQAAVPAELWTTQLEVEPSSLMQNGVFDSGAEIAPDVFDGAGPTGTYTSGTAGKHTQNTVAIANQDFTHGQVLTYQYTFHYIAYNPDGTRHPITYTSVLGTCQN